MPFKWLSVELTIQLFSDLTVFQTRNPPALKQGTQHKQQLWAENLKFQCLAD